MPRAFTSRQISALILHVKMLPGSSYVMMPHCQCDHYLLAIVDSQRQAIGCYSYHEGIHASSLRRPAC